MQSSARFVSILVLQSLLATWAFAGDPKPAPTSQEAATSETASPSPAPQADPQATPTPKPATIPSSSGHSSMRGPDTPGGELFVGYSYLRMNTNSQVGPFKIDESFDFIPGGS